MNNDILCFDHVADVNAKLLILGSIPGIRSLEKVQYYAHPRNQFWKIMAQLFKFDVECSYEKKLQILLSHNIALWDVISQCHRIGSLDTAIKNPIPNDFNRFFSEHNNIKAIAFNGQKAYKEFEKKVLPNLNDDFKEIKRISLPSTSPANASMNYQQKYEIWNQLLSYI